MEKLYKNNFILKLIAVVTMVIDHVGGIFFPHSIVFRIIGRLSFPLFGYLIAEGYDRTKNQSAYILRMVLFFALSQIPYTLAFVNHQLNIFATFCFALSIIWLLTTTKIDTFKKISFVCLLLFIAFILPLDYGLGGVLSIIIFYFYKHSHKKLFLLQLLLWSTYTLFIFLNSLIGGKHFVYPNDILQIIAPFSVIIISILNYFYSSKSYWHISRNNKYIIQYSFYLFYPVHLFILYKIYLLIQ